MTGPSPVPEFESLRFLWNCAADYGADGEVPEDAPLGVEHLSHLLRVYNSAMGGGLGFAIQVNEEFRLRRAVDAARYLGLVGLAELLEDLIARYGDGAYAESRDSDLVTILGQRDEHLEAAFRAKAAESPADFGLH
ncbi:hypothetical protein ACQP2P_30605 [Dactylosporangium sp. CA-139114]|uniref:hypothetical protein n=1 Tax=Dactylosporangium sp. CA-139114 TaxID=3239931 RepID=UPI003D98D3D6